MEERRVTFIGVDRRLRESAVVDALSGDPDLGLVFLHLDEGHYLLSRETAVVNLSLSHFLKSVKNGGLTHWADTLSSRYSEPILIVEGADLASAEKISGQDIKSALDHVLSERTIPVLFTETPVISAEIIAFLARYLGEISTPRLDILQGEKRMGSPISTLGSCLARGLHERIGNSQGEIPDELGAFFDLPGVRYENPRGLEALLEMSGE
jgi:ERCC4-type nuclease